MRVREIFFHNFRSFRGERHISFVDSLTNEVRSVSVLAGSNGSGKTTILEAIEALLEFVLNPEVPKNLITEAWENGLVCLEIELFPEDFSHFSLNGETSKIMHIAVGQRDLVPVAVEETWPNLFCHLIQQNGNKKPFIRKSNLAEKLRNEVKQARQRKDDLRGGFLYFPHDRQLNVTKGGAVEPPSEETSWVFRFSRSDRWKGSLEQLWVWQNYLDLEQGNQERNNLKPFVALVENVLGENRPITVSGGRAMVPAAWSNSNGESTKVHLDQLPSGEQQCLLLFGELARRKRKSAIIAIDEIENSLHPTLQRLVMWNLRKIAREWDAQVIVTTHSLEIINTVRGSAFINLDYPEDHFNLPILDENEGNAA
ncbi:MAG: AAA family ATPase [Anaerolineales bacterium]|nr:AAA family ATPase [Anaerolineales bacterium]